MKAGSTENNFLYVSLFAFGFTGAVMLSHVLTTYSNLSLGFGLAIFLIFAAIALITAVCVMYAAYSSKKFDATAIKSGGSIGALISFVVLVALLLGVFI